MGYEVTDNFLSEQDFKKIQNTMYSENFPWFYNPSITLVDADDEDPHDFQFTHIFYKDAASNSPYFEMLAPVFEILQPYAILRVKANMTASTPNQHINGWHTDYDPSKVKCNTGVLYMNDNDGFTIFKDSDEKIESVANRFVRFDSDMLHSGASCTNAKNRMVINFNWI